MTVTTDQIAKVKAAGFQNVEHIANACDATGCMFYLAVAMIEKESKGRNGYGSDSGGMLEDFPIQVNKGNFEAFEYEVVKHGRTSNGVGPAQLTYRGFFPQLRAEGLNAWEPADNIFFGVRLLYGYYKKARGTTSAVRDPIRWAGTWYNAGPNEKQIIDYGDDLLNVALKWKNIVGNADYS